MVACSSVSDTLVPFSYVSDTLVAECYVSDTLVACNYVLDALVACSYVSDTVVACSYISDTSVACSYVSDNSVARSTVAANCYFYLLDFYSGMSVEAWIYFSCPFLYVHGKHLFYFRKLFQLCLQISRKIIYFFSCLQDMHAFLKKK